MTILLHNSSKAGIYDRWGVLMGVGLDLLSLMGGSSTTNVASGASLVTRENNLYTYFQNTTPLPAGIDGWDGATASARQAMQGLLTSIGKYVQQSGILMANADTALPQQTITEALKLLIAQMVGTSDSINASTVAFGAQTAVGSPVGNPVAVLTAYRRDGLVSQTTLAEVLTFRVTGDAGSGGTATAGNEPFAVVGQQSYPVNDYRWPGGSGVSTTLSAVDGSKSNSTGNVLSNSDFATVSNANLPDNWAASVGSVGTRILSSPGNAFSVGGGCLEFVGDGSTLTAVTQAFNTANSTSAGSGGTPYVLLPNTVYILNGWVKCTSVPTAGVLTFSLTDSAGTALTDAQGVSNSFPWDLTSGGHNVGATYKNVNGVFRTSGDLTTGNLPLKLRVANTTAIDNSKNIFFGRFSLTPATQLYAAGPFCAVFSGSTKVANGANPDTWTVAVTNTMGVFAKELERYLGLSKLTGNGGLPLQIPYSGSPTVPDSYVA